MLVQLGSTDEGESDVRHHAQSLRLELGYGFVTPSIELRPSLRAGFALVTTPRDASGDFVSPDLGLGLTACVPFDPLFVGLDAEARYFTRLIENPDTSFSLTSFANYLTAGHRF